VWTYSALAKHKDQHLEQTACVTEEHVQRNKGKTNDRKGRQVEMPTTGTNTESTAESVTCTPRKSSRIAKTENTEQVTRKTVSPKKLDSHTKKRLHDGRPPHASSENVCNIANDAKKARKATPKTQQTSHRPNNTNTIKFSPEHPGRTRKWRLQKDFVRKMAAMKKKFVPLKLHQQNDPLHEK